MSNGDIVLAKPLYGGDIAFCLLNETDAAKQMILSWDYCGWEMTDTIHLRDVTAHRDLGNFLHGAHFDVPAHSAIVLRAHRVGRNNWHPLKTALWRHCKRADA